MNRKGLPAILFPENRAKLKYDEGWDRIFGPKVIRVAGHWVCSVCGSHSHQQSDADSCCATEKAIEADPMLLTEQERKEARMLEQLRIAIGTMEIATDAAERCKARAEKAEAELDRIALASGWGERPEGQSGVHRPADLAERIEKGLRERARYGELYRGTWETLEAVAKWLGLEAEGLAEDPSSAAIPRRKAEAALGKAVEFIRLQDPRNAAERYDRIADAFEAKHHLLAPGRSRPPEIGADPSPDVTGLMWRAFCNEWHEREFDEALAAAKDVLP